MAGRLCSGLQLIVCSVWALSNVVDGEDYLIGLGSYDMTCPASNVNMMGYANMGPGGYLQYVVYSITSLGFVHQSFDAIVDAIEQCVVQAHNNLKPGSIFINKGEVANAGINRSPSAYLLNPPQERSRYANNVDKEMTLLKFVDRDTGKSVGSFNWFATHGTSMNKNNKLISGDNKGAAANTKTQSRSPTTAPSMVAKARRTKATGGQTCDKSTSREFKVRSTSGTHFVGAFCQSNVGDVRSVSTAGSLATSTTLPVTAMTGSAWAVDPGTRFFYFPYPDEIQSTKIIGERQFIRAVDLFNTARDELNGRKDYRHVYINFTNIEVDLGGGDRTVKTCPAALGPGFATGTTDGPGAFGFQQGDT
ncbi:Neutral ceramidase [Acorus calamus]|uniref:Neutral ceramidase n=1 Tax=Acorus calamus TaxID=4465 RepID=A0AAV9D3J7_ACOCL|nr:Neutral ceramidase [Acorus calamus]